MATVGIAALGSSSGMGFPLLRLNLWLLSLGLVCLKTESKIDLLREKRLIDCLRDLVVNN